MNLIDHIIRQKKFSINTFGPGARTDGIIDHIKKELGEVKNKPGDLMEWVDLIMLSIDGAWRAGHSPQEIAKALEQKLTVNESRSWPDWREQPDGKAIEHIRG
jgi:hypothetical protein